MQHHSLLGKCKQRTQWDHYTPTRVPKSKTKQQISMTPNADEDAEKTDHSYVTNRNIQWYSLSESGKQFGFFWN